MSELTAMCERIGHVTDTLADAPFSPDLATEIYALKEAVARLETAVASTAIAGRAGDLVGSSDPSHFYIGRLGMMRSSAKKLLKRAESVWPSHVSSETQDVILEATAKLADDPAKQRALVGEAHKLANGNSPEQVRSFVAKRVREEKSRQDKDPLKAEKTRYCSLSKQDENGMATLKAKLPAHSAALLKSLLDRAFKHGAGRPADVNAVEDPRTLDQRRADAFSYVISQASSTQLARTGHASLVVSVVASDLTESGMGARFSTNTGFDLSLLDIARLGSGLEDYFVVHNEDGGFVAMATGQRCATFYQKIALLALDLVCQHPGCDRPHSECDVHHIVAYLMGGATSLENLTLLCRKHHRHNDDTRCRPNRGYVDKQGADTVRVFGDQRTPNTSLAAQQSARWRIRDRRAA